MNFKNLNLGEKIILGGSALAVISLFMPWVTVFGLSQSGLDQGGYLFLLACVYQCIMVFTQKKPIKGLSIALSAIGVVLMFIFYKSKSADVFGVSINAAGSGMYIMIIALLVVLIGSFLNNRE